MGVPTPEEPSVLGRESLGSPGALTKDGERQRQKETELGTKREMAREGVRDRKTESRQGEQ